MNIHEYQAKKLLSDFGVPVPKGLPAFSVEEAVKNLFRSYKASINHINLLASFCSSFPIHGIFLIIKPESLSAKNK